MDGSAVGDYSIILADTLIPPGKKFDRFSLISGSPAKLIKKIDIKTEALVGFEIFVDNLKKPQKLLKDQKKLYQVSDFQKSERDFAFIIDKNFKSQELIYVISNVNS